MTHSPHLLYVGGPSPQPGSGSLIILQRHLAYLVQENWRIALAVAARTAPPASDWPMVRVPFRRAWWPPFRPDRPWLARIRAWAWTREVRTLPAPDLVLTLCWGPLAWLAADIAERRRVPLAVILHDHWAELADHAAATIGQRVCRAAHTVFTVSEEMSQRVDGEFGRGKSLLLPPVPAARCLPFAAWRATHATAPVLAHVGALHPYHVPFLTRTARALAPLHGRLLVLCDSGSPVLRNLRAAIPNLTHQPFFPTNDEALRFVAGNATAFVVMYPFGGVSQNPAPTGFPSRLIEFLQLGLPALLAAPEGNPLRSWAHRAHWPAHFAPDDDAALTRACAALTDSTAWEEMAAAARRVAQGEFDAANIHRLFRQRLEAILDTAS